MELKDDHEIAMRIAEISAWSFDEALEALQEGGKRREIALYLLRSSERTERVLERSREFRRNLRRYRLGLP
jgi:PHD/YefM family antitoxin component YafN of YafNO toxin-antitoxin module